MINKSQISRNSKRIGLAALAFATILLTSCPAPKPARPVAPGNFIVTAGNAEVTLTWDAVTGAASYRVYRDDERIAINTTITTTTYTDNTAINTTTYTYTVRAVGSTGAESPHSDPVSVTLPMTTFDALADAGNNTPTGIWSDDTTMWVADTTDRKIYAYRMSDASHDASRDFNTLAEAGNTFPQGIWSNGSTMWVVDLSARKLFAYDLASKAHVPALDFNDLRDDGIIIPESIWSDGTTMWVLDDIAKKLFAYKMMDKMRDPMKDIALATGNTFPQGIWSRDGTMWVSDTADAKLYAYDLAGTLVPSQDFDTLSAAGNNAPTYMWSNADTMWVLSPAADTIYPYNLATKAPIP